jgi:CBS domain-containing protein
MTPLPMAAATPAADRPIDEAWLRAELSRASDVGRLAAAAACIPRLAAQAIDAGADVATTTRLISGLNDEVTVRVVRVLAAQMDVDLARACWLVFGSQARGEQTLVSDQDNGLVFAGSETDRPRWMAFGQRVNEALARCGYPLCDGNVMAGQPLCCLTAEEWCARFEHWMAHGSGNDLFAARIYFDLRALVGKLELAQPLADLLRSPAAAVPRFVKQMADIVLCNHVPLGWLGQVVTTKRDHQQIFDLKMSGTALFVDAARLWALAHSIAPTGTADRLRLAAQAMHVPVKEVEQWIDGFHTLQGLRLQIQRHRVAGASFEDRCRARWDDLNAEQRAALKQALRAARWVQQRIALDYQR